MNESLDLSRLQAIADATSLIDPGILEMLPDGAREIVVQGPAAITALIAKVGQLQTQFTELNLALVEYANQSGAGQMMMDNLKLCLDQVRMQKAKASPMNATFNRLDGQGRG